jgi:hypothetical protein
MRFRVFIGERLEARVLDGLSEHDADTVEPLVTSDFLNLSQPHRPGQGNLVGSITPTVALASLRYGTIGPAMSDKQLVDPAQKRCR